MFFSTQRKRIDRLFTILNLIITAFELYVKREINMSTIDNAIADVTTAEGSMETRLQAVIDALKANQNDPAAVATQVAELEALAARMAAFNAPAPAPTPTPAPAA